MGNLAKRIGGLALAALVIAGASVPPAGAQGRRLARRPAPRSTGSAGTLSARIRPGRLDPNLTRMPLNRNWLIGPGLTLRQWTHNTRQMGRALREFPPWAAAPGSWSGSVPGPGEILGPGSSLTSDSDWPGSGDAAPEQPAGEPGRDDAGFLEGTAAVIKAQGELAVQLEQAHLTREQAKSQEIQNRKALFDEILYERANTPGLIDLLIQAQAQELRRAQGTAPDTEIWSGKTLNTLLREIKRLHGQQVYGPEVEVEPDVLRQLNFRPAGKTGNLGVLRGDGGLNWPLGLRTGPSAALRALLDKKVREAIRQAADGRVETGLIGDLRANVKKLHKLLARSVIELSTDDYVDAKRYLNDLDGAVKVLAQPDAVNYFNRLSLTRGKSVRELADYMLNKGLDFAPAVSGGEAAYQAVYQALLAYDLAARAKAPKHVLESKSTRE